MKRIAVALLGLLGLVATADGADIQRRGNAVAANTSGYAPIYDWTGLYLGLTGGGTWGHSSWNNPSTDDFVLSGGLVGGTIGYNWRTGKIVYGAEADISWVRAKGDTSLSCPPGCETSQHWLGTARGRIGYAFDRLMPYLTGGAALGDIKAGRPGFAGASTTNLGWAVGGGLEFAIARNWTAKAEYLHADLGDLNCGAACGAAAAHNVDLQQNVVRAGLNYRF